MGIEIDDTRMDSAGANAGVKWPAGGRSAQVSSPSMNSCGWHWLPMAATGWMWLLCIWFFCKIVMELSPLEIAVPCISCESSRDK